MNRPNPESYSEGSSLEVTTASQQAVLKAGFIVLIVFAIIKPISLMGGANLSVGLVELTDVMGLSVSYLLILPLFAGIKQVKVDLFSIFILIFIFYVIESIFWGSEIRKVGKVILPFIVFFSVRTFITQKGHTRLLIAFLVVGFLIPIVFSTYNIVLGKSIYVVEWHNKLARYSGSFSGPHTLSYIMLFFSFLYCILNHVYRFKKSFNRYLIVIFLLLSVFCLYKSGTRTAMIGFILFWFIYLWGTNKKEFFVVLVISALTAIIFSGHIYSIIFKKEEIDFNTATSGRVTLIENNIDLFFQSNLTQQLFGRGLGHEHQFLFHNDYITLLLSLGVIGLLLYLIILFYLFFDIFLYNDKKTKYLFGAILISVAAMNFGSNAVIFRVELSQYFWCIIGLFYVIKEYKNERNQNQIDA